MLLSIASDYARSQGNPEADLRKIAEAGFDGIQWVHHWNTDFIYTRPEIRQIGKWLKAFDLKLYDLHATDGVEKRWYSVTEYEREAGVELVRNRIEMTRELGGKVMVMHVPRRIPDNQAKWEQLRRSLDELEGVCRDAGIRIAVENIPFEDFKGIGELMRDYSPDYLGLCYDSGHGNMGGKGLGHLAKFAKRLLAIHLHDNNGYDDQHKPLFSGTIDWQRLAKVISASSYDGPLTLEVGFWNSGIADEAAFLRREHASAKKLAAMVRK
jgi:sugar phosphate isomerase/epimerase